jgi:cytochrome c-type biogenesis protein CcmH
MTPSVLVFASLSILLAIAVFGLVLRPLRRDKPMVAVVVATVFVGATMGLYRMIGTPQALELDNLQTPQDMAQAVAMLERKMAETPEREGFVLLAEAYTRLERDEAARDAWERALSMSNAQTPAQPSELAAAAEARMRTDTNRRFDARAVGYLEQALKQDPKHQRARFFMGLALRQQGKAADAAAMWEPLLSQLDAANTLTLRQEVDAARKDAGLPPLPAAADAASAQTAAAASDRQAEAAGVRVTVSLDPAFAARVRLRGDASVFVIARAVGGPPMPVAVEKHPLSALPLNIVLDDSDGPMPTAKLSSLRQVEVFARLSESGQATRQDGDLESAPVRVDLPAKSAVTLVLGTAP